MKKDRIYMCIDMKSFFASVECAERGLNPLTANLVVADERRGSGTICLAVSPNMKKLGVRNRCRYYEIPQGIEFVTALPRMQKYIDYAAAIYGIYLDYMDKADIYVYSIDESFIDATDYLALYKMSPQEYAKMLMGKIAEKLHIPSTAGIGTNLYLAKIALDITAKKTPEHIGFLDEQSFKATLWKHRPLTDFWGIGGGISKRLEKFGIFDMEGIAKAPEDVLYREFGINAELMIDHAYGREPCLMSDIKNYRSKSKSFSSEQVLFRDYSYAEAKIIVEEMVRTGCLDLMRHKAITGSVDLHIGYSGRERESVHAHKRMGITTNLPEKIMPFVMEMYDKKVDKKTPIRRVGIGFDNVCDEACEGYDLFTDWDAVQKQKSVAKTILELQDKFGKNAVVMASDLQESATLIERNKLIGGHNSQ